MINDLIKKAELVGIEPMWLVREYLQKVILYGFSALDIDRHYVFQGGTAIRLIYESPRFSLDLDFTANHKTDNIATDTSKLENFLLRFLAPWNLDAKKTREKADEGFYRCFFSFDTTEYLGRKIRIKFEVSIRKYMTVKFERKILTIEQPARVAFSIQTKSPNQILSDKVCSLAGSVHRGYIRWRDVFDMYWLTIRYRAKIEENYFKQEFGSWIETRDDIIRAIETLKNILSTKDYSDAQRELAKLLPKNLATDDLIEQYIKTTIKVLEEAKNYV